MSQIDIDIAISLDAEYGIEEQMQRPTADIETAYIRAQYQEKPVYEAVKRVFDIVFSIIGIIVASPIMLATAVAIKLEDGGPVIFREKCIGRYGKDVIKLKFRSMKTNSDEIMAQFNAEQRHVYSIGGKMHNDPRLTKTGAFIRKTSIDELMQFVSIMRGDLSFVGPRLINTRELEFYGANKEKFLSVMPGLTGWWQVNGRSNITYEKGERQKLELYYVDNRSFWLDLRILFKTVVIVLTRVGAY